MGQSWSKLPGLQPESRKQVWSGEGMNHRPKAGSRQKMPPAGSSNRPCAVLGWKPCHSVQPESWTGAEFSVRQTDVWPKKRRGPAAADIWIIPVCVQRKAIFEPVAGILPLA